MKVINLWGGPGTGKSTTAAELFVKLKKQNVNVELVTEYAKDLTYEQRYNVLEEDQLYILTKQFRRLYRLRKSVDIVITDSPLLLGCVYFTYNDNQPLDYDLFEELSFHLNDNFINYHIVLNGLDNLVYSEIGRNQTLEEAKALDDSIFDFLIDTRIQFKELSIPNDNLFEEIMNYVSLR